MEDHTNELSEGRIPFLDYKTYTDRVFFLPSKDGANDVMITGKLDIPEARRATVTQALNQFSNLLNSKTFLINVIIAHPRFIKWESKTHADIKPRGRVISWRPSIALIAIKSHKDMYHSWMMYDFSSHTNSRVTFVHLSEISTSIRWIALKFGADTSYAPQYNLQLL